MIAPLSYHKDQDLGNGVLNLRWAFRKLSERNVHEALEEHSASYTRKHRRVDSGSEKSRKKTKSSSVQRNSLPQTKADQAPTSSRFSHRSTGSKPGKLLVVKLKRCPKTASQQKTTMQPTSPQKAGCHRLPSTSSSTPSDESGHRTNLASQGEVRVLVPNCQDTLCATLQATDLENTNFPTVLEM